MRLEDYLALHACQSPQKVAVFSGGEECTYAEFYQRVQQRTAEIKNSFEASECHSFRLEETAIPFRSSQSIDFLVEYMGIHLAGAAAVPLEHDLPDDRYDEIVSLLSTVTVPEGSADVLFTTGTTGRSKGVIMSHRTIIADAENLIDGQGFTPGIVFVITGPLNHIGSLSKIWPVFMLGATLYITGGMKNIEDFYTALEYVPSHVSPAGGAGQGERIQRYATFLVPASIRMLLQLSHDRFAQYADRIDFLETGAAPIMQSDMEELCRILPHSRLYNTYASTETGIITTYNYNRQGADSTSPSAACLGRHMRHSRLFITPEGTIACQGPTLMTGYIGDPELTATVLRDYQSPGALHPEPTLFTADRGMIDDEGRLHLLGREDDVINVGGFKVAPTEVEDAAMSLPQVADCICIAAAHPIVGRALKLLVVPAPGYDFDKRVVARWLKTRLESYKVPLLYEQVDKVNRTYNGKLNRKAYRQRND